MRGGRYAVNIVKVVEFLNWTYQCVKEKYCQYFGVAFFFGVGKNTNKCQKDDLLSVTFLGTLETKSFQSKGLRTFCATHHPPCF